MPPEGVAMGKHGSASPSGAYDASTCGAEDFAEDKATALGNTPDASSTGAKAGESVFSLFAAPFLDAARCKRLTF
jgi:hypothetical protein